MSDDKTKGFMMDPETGDILEGPPIPHDEMSKIIIGYIAISIINRAADQVTPPENPIKDIRRRRRRAEGLFLDAMASGLVSYSTYIENTFTWPEEEKRACIIEIKSRIEQAEEDLHKFYNGETWAEMRPLLMKTFPDICEEDAAGLLFSGLANSLKDYLPDLAKKVEAYNHETGGRITFKDLMSINTAKPREEWTREDGLLYWFIQEIDQERAADKQFITDKYMITPESAISDAMSMLNRRSRKENPITGRMETKFNGVSISDIEDIHLIMGIDSSKVLMRAEAEFRHRNHAGTIQTYEVVIYEDEYFQLLNDDVKEWSMNTPEGQKEEKRRVSALKRELRRTTREALECLYNSSFSIEKEGKDGAKSVIFGQRRIIDGYDYPPGADAITITFAPNYAEYLKKRRVWRLPLALFSWDGRRASSYALGYKIAYHYSSLNNYINGTADRLQVRTLLDRLYLRSIEEVRKQKGSWKRVIRGPFEDALNELIEGGYLKEWRYTREKAQPIEDENALSTYEKWADSYIQFTVADPIPEEERLKDVQNKTEKQKKLAKKSRAAGKKKAVRRSSAES